MSKKLIMCRGLPGSGKSTWAIEQINESWIQDAGPRKVSRVNKDEIREYLSNSGWVWSHENEKDVVKERNRRIKADFDLGIQTVISDDTNFGKHENQLRMLALECGAEFEVKDFTDVPVKTCILRDSQRVGRAKVGQDVIIKMAKQNGIKTDTTVIQPTFDNYVPKANSIPAVICDLDGTLALHVGRGPFEYEKCDTDKLNLPVAATLKAMRQAGYQTIFISGREDSCRAKTQAWLDHHLGTGAGPLFMRVAKDWRKDWIIKGEIFDREIRDKYNVIFCLDDRNQVVDFYRSIGLTVFQVAPGAF